MKKIYALGAVAMALLTTGCSNDLTNNDSGIDNTGKERILFSAGDDGETVMKTRAGFTDQTRIVARIVSEKRGGGDAKCVRTVLLASKEENDNTYSKVAYAENKTRYWDDAYGRSSILSVYAVAIPNVNDGTDASNLKESVLKGADSWDTANAGDNNISWTVKATQEYADLAAQDLTYSNNIQETGDKGVVYWDYENKAYIPAWNNNEINATKHTYGDPEQSDGRLYFTQEGKAINVALDENPGHFDRGHMDFKHALSRIQINLIKDVASFGSSSFELTGNLQLNAMPYSGTLDIKAGTWASSPTTGSVNAAKWTKAADGKTLTYEAQVLPGYVFTDTSNDNTLQFTIGGNTYYVTKDMLHDALESAEQTDFTMQQGTRYIFDVTVKKTKIENITATIVPWNVVTADNTDVDNSHLTFTFYNGGTACTDINLYKYEQDLGKVYTDDSYTANPVAGSAYTEVAGLTQDGETGTYKTSEYYNDNQTAYHFRSINNIAENALNDGKTAFTMTSGEADEEINDYHWGAPMKTGLTSDKLPYSATDGYLSSIAKGIVAAKQESQINLTEVHMMSQLVIKLTSIPLTGQTNDAKVTLADAKVTLTKFSKTGTVDMGSGKITPNTTSDATNGIGNSSAITVSENDGEYSCTINVVPQALVRNEGASDDDYVGITIKTTDNNEYYIVKRLSEIIATSTGSEVTNMQQAGEGKYITRWYPGHKYTYTFNITKKKIDVITATIVPWNEVVAGNTDLDLEK